MTPRPCDILRNRPAAEARADAACCSRSDTDIAANIAAIQKLGWRLSDLIQNVGSQFQYHQEQRAQHNCQDKIKPAAVIVKEIKSETLGDLF